MNKKDTIINEWVKMRQKDRLKAARKIAEKYGFDLKYTQRVIREWVREKDKVVKAKKELEWKIVNIVETLKKDAGGRAWDLFVAEYKRKIIAPYKKILTRAQIDTVIKKAKKQAMGNTNASDRISLTQIYKIIQLTRQIGYLNKEQEQQLKKHLTTLTITEGIKIIDTLTKLANLTNVLSGKYGDKIMHILSHADRLKLDNILNKRGNACENC